LTLEVDASKQFNADVVLPGPDGVLGTADDVSAPRADPVNTGPFAHLIPLVSRDNPDTVGPDTNYLHYTGDGDIQTAASAVAIGGPGNDFIYGSKANEFAFGNEGDDWIERGTTDGAAGDNFDPFGNEPVKGNDVFLGDGAPDNVDGEGGDDIYIATPSEADRFIGFGGFDWATFKDDAVGVTVGLDSSQRFFDQPLVPGSASSIISRLDLVEGLSGSKHDDFLVGDDANAAKIATAGVGGSVLTNPGVIDGLQAFLNDFKGTPATPVVTQFGDGNIILGGAGSDIIMGRGGD